MEFASPPQTDFLMGDLFLNISWKMDGPMALLLPEENEMPPLELIPLEEIPTPVPIQHGINCNCYLQTEPPSLSKDLYTAISAEKFSEVRSILNRYPSWVNFARENDNTPLHIAIQSGSLEMIELLFEVGAKTFLTPNADGITPLQLARGNPELEARLQQFRTFRIALATQNLAAIEDCLNVHPTWIFSRSVKNSTPIQFAIQKQNRALIQLLLRLDPTVLIPTEGPSPLLAAIKTGNRSIVKCFLDVNPSLIRSLTRKDETVLHEAARIENPKMMQFLLQQIPEWIDRPDGNRRIPIWVAIITDHPSVVELLLRWGSQVRKYRTPDQKTLLQAAIQLRCTAIAEILMQYEPDLIDALDSDGKSALHYAATANNTYLGHRLIQICPTSITSIAANGEIPLHIAVRQGNLELTNLLLAKDWIDFPNNGGDTPFHIAVMGNNKPILERLLRAKSQALNLPGRHGNTPLHLAAENCDLSMVKFLLQAGSDSLDDTNTGGYTPIQIAAGEQKSSLVEEFLQFKFHQIDFPSRIDSLSSKEGMIETYWILERTYRSISPILRYQTSDGRRRDLDVFRCRDWTPLHFAVQYGHEAVIELLIPNDAMIGWRRRFLDRPDSVGRTPLHLAVQLNHTGMVKQLLRIRPPEPWIPIRPSGTVIKITPFHMAVFENHLLMVKVLLRTNGELLNLPDSNGSMPLDYARFQGHHIMCRILVALGASSNSGPEFRYPRWLHHPGTIQQLPIQMDEINLSTSQISEIRSEIYFDQNLLSILLDSI